MSFAVAFKSAATKAPATTRWAPATSSPRSPTRSPSPPRIEAMRHPDSYRFDSTHNEPRTEIEEIGEAAAKLLLAGDQAGAVELVHQGQTRGLSVDAMMKSARFYATKLKP